MEKNGLKRVPNLFPSRNTFAYLPIDFVLPPLLFTHTQVASPIPRCPHHLQSWYFSAKRDVALKLPSSESSCLHLTFMRLFLTSSFGIENLLNDYFLIETTSNVLECLGDIVV